MAFSSSRVEHVPRLEPLAVCFNQIAPQEHRHSEKRVLVRTGPAYCRSWYSFCRACINYHYHNELGKAQHIALIAATSAIDWRSGRAYPCWIPLSGPRESLRCRCSSFMVHFFVLHTTNYQYFICFLLALQVSSTHVPYTWCIVW